MGLVFIVFGLNGFLQFIPMGPPPGGMAGQFIEVLTKSHYALFVAGIEVIGGALLLANRYTTFGLTLLGPIVVNILLVHTLLLPQGLPIAIVTALLWFLTAYPVRANFAGLFKSP